MRSNLHLMAPPEKEEKPPVRYHAKVSERETEKGEKFVGEKECLLMRCCSFVRAGEDSLFLPLSGEK